MRRRVGSESRLNSAAVRSDLLVGHRSQHLGDVVFVHELDGACAVSSEASDGTRTRSAGFVSTSSKTSNNGSVGQWGPHSVLHLVGQWPLLFWKRLFDRRAAAQPTNFFEERHPALGLGRRRVGQLEVHAAAGVVEALGLDAPALALGRGQLDVRSKLVERGAHWAVARARRGAGSRSAARPSQRLSPWLTVFVVCVFWLVLRIVVLAFCRASRRRCEGHTGFGSRPPSKAKNVGFRCLFGRLE